MTIHNILKRYKYLIITRKNQIVPLFKLLAKDEHIRWASGCDIKEYNREFKDFFDYYKTDSFVSIDLNTTSYNNKIYMSYETYSYYNSPELVFDDNTYILAQDLLTASKKSIIILNKN